MPQPETVRGSQSIGRAAAVLACFQESESLSVTDVSNLLELSPPTAHRILRALVGAGLLGQDPRTSRYHLGSGIAAVGALASRRLGYEAARPELQRLAELLGLTVTLGVNYGAESLVVEVVTPQRFDAIQVEPGQRSAIHACAMGKSVAAFAATGQARSSDVLARFTPKTIVSAEDLSRELTQVRSRGWSMNDEELHTGIKGVGAPISGGDGRVVAAVAVAAPASLLIGSALVNAVSATKETATRIGDLIVGA